MSGTIGRWALVLFLLWYGLAVFIPALDSENDKKVRAALAVIAALGQGLALLGVG